VVDERRAPGADLEALHTGQDWAGAPFGFEKSADGRRQPPQGLVRQGQLPEPQGRVGHAHPALVDLHVRPDHDIQVASPARGGGEAESQ
jgi:hypothetical protein